MSIDNLINLFKKVKFDRIGNYINKKDYKYTLFDSLSSSHRIENHDMSEVLNLKWKSISIDRVIFRYEIHKMVREELSEIKNQKDKITSEVLYDLTFLHNQKISGMLKDYNVHVIEPNLETNFVIELLSRKKIKNQPRLLILEGHDLLDIITKIELSKIIFPKIDIIVSYQASGLNTMKLINDFASVLIKSHISGLTLQDSYDLTVKDYRTSLTKKMHLLFNCYFTQIDPKLYVLVAPPGYGKSSIMDQLRLHNFRMLKTVTTRIPRSNEEFERGEKEFISQSEFNYLKKYNHLTSTVFYQREKYAFRLSDLNKIYASGKHHICDMASIREAVRLQQERPDLVRLIFITPPRSFAGYGLEQRLNHLHEPSECFSSVEEEIQYLTRRKETTQDTQRRLNQSISDYTAYLKHIQFADLVIPSTTILQNTARIYDHIMQTPGLFETFRYVE